SAKRANLRTRATNARQSQRCCAPLATHAAMLKRSSRPFSIMRFAFAGPNSGRYSASTGRLFTSRQKLVLRRSMSNFSGRAALFDHLQLNFSIVCFGRGKFTAVPTSLQKLRKRQAPSLAVPDPVFPCRCSERLNWLAQFSFIAKKSGRLGIGRLICCRISLH